MIDEALYAFGLDTEQYSSSPITDRVERLMDWRVAALHEPLITFVWTRSGISWGYKDHRFDYNWQGIRDMDMYRTEAGISAYPVGRGAYHVLYPSQNAIVQYDNFMEIVDPVADWEHDRACIDAELNQGQDRRTITNRIKDFAYAVERATGRYPVLYARAGWLNQFAYPQELTFLDAYLAQYLYTVVGDYTPEYPPPPDLPIGFSDWLIHQTGDHCPPIGTPVKKVMDYNRWNGGAIEVAKYFNYYKEPEPEPKPTPPGVILKNRLRNYWHKFKRVMRLPH